jgi:hypothetical protein
MANTASKVSPRNLVLTSSKTAPTAMAQPVLVISLEKSVGKLWLHGVQYPDQVRDVIADRIIEFGRASNERDPRRLARTVVASLGIKL